VILRAGIALGILVLMTGSYLLWKRPPRRLRRLDLAGLGIRGPAIVQFTTETCAPCKAVAPTLQDAADRATVPFQQFDVGQRPEVARAYGIRTVPTIAVTGRNGRVTEVWTALPASGEVARAIGRVLGADAP
jgi:thioredoxin-like negative regulator of GroEL